MFWVEIECSDWQIDHSTDRLHRSGDAAVDYCFSSPLLHLHSSSSLSLSLSVYAMLTQTNQYLCADTKVTELDLSSGVYQHIGRLDICGDKLRHRTATSALCGVSLSTRLFFFLITWPYTIPYSPLWSIFRLHRYVSPLTTYRQRRQKIYYKDSINILPARWAWQGKKTCLNLEVRWKENMTSVCTFTCTDQREWLNWTSMWGKAREGKCICIAHVLSRYEQW